MKRVFLPLKPFVAAIALCLALPAAAADVETLFDELAQASPDQVPGLAEKIREEWAQSGSAAIDLLFRRGRDAIQMGDFSAGIGHLSAAIDHAPGFTEAYYQRAIAYLNAGLTGPAVSDLRVVLSAEPRHFDALEMMAILHQELDNPEQAMRLWDEVERLLPGYETALEAREALIRQLEGTEL